MIKTLITPTEVYELAYSTVREYTPVEVITEADINLAEQKFLVPIIGEELYGYLFEEPNEEENEALLEDYIYPALSLCVREVVNAPSAPASKDGMSRARAMMRRMSDYLDDNQSLYPKYVEANNILKRCRIHGSDIQIP